MINWKLAFIILATAAVAGTGGYFTGRWHVKREIVGAMDAAIADVGKTFASGMGESLAASPAEPEKKPWEGAGATLANELIKTGSVQVFREGKDFGIALPFVNASKSAIIDVYIADVRDEFGNAYQRDVSLSAAENYQRFWKARPSVKDHNNKVRPGEAGTSLTLCDMPVDAARTMFVRVYVSGDAIKSESYWVKVDLPAK